MIWCRTLSTGLATRYLVSDACSPAAAIDHWGAFSSLTDDRCNQSPPRPRARRRRQQLTYRCSFPEPRRRSTAGQCRAGDGPAAAAARCWRWAIRETPGFIDSLVGGFLMVDA
jgi:hypothetical protein